MIKSVTGPFVHRKPLAKDYLQMHVFHEITYPFPNFNGCTAAEIRNFIPHFIACAITDPCRENEFLLLKEVPNRLMVYTMTGITLQTLVAHNAFSRVWVQSDDTKRRNSCGIPLIATMARYFSLCISKCLQSVARTTDQNSLNLFVGLNHSIIHHI